MGIAALPANAVHAIGSTQCLTDPVALVKELVENSLDAKATSILIEIAPNTIDRIKVRDNGHTIAPEDRALVCKRYCTSKIRNLEDLHDLGGQSLGFRGEALASALELSSKILISTRIEGERTAVEMKFGRDGVVESERRLSLPVGTTVAIDHFLSGFPVRKQMAEKNSSKYLSKIKTLLQEYVLARPAIRISFKVLKAKNTNGDWRYGPRPELINEFSFKSLILDAAMKVFGTKAADSLLYRADSWMSTREITGFATRRQPDQKANVEDQYMIECLIIDPGRMNSMPSGSFGQHIAIDNRPVSCGRGTPKQICSLYKSCLRSVAERLGSSCLPNPLLVMNLRCPKGSYDVNLDPAKDEVLFYDNELVLQRVLSNFIRVYGEKEPSPAKRFTEAIGEGDCGFNMLLARESVKEAAARFSEPPSPHDAGVQPTDLVAHVSRNDLKNGVYVQTQKVSHEIHNFESDPNLNTALGDEDEAGFLTTRNAMWKSSMGKEEYNEFELQRRSSTCSQEVVEFDEDENLHDISISNPWAFAKLNKHFRTPLERHQNEPNGISCDNPQTSQQQDGNLSDVVARSPGFSDQSPCTSTHFFLYPQRAYGKRLFDDENTSSPTSRSNNRGEGALDVWLQSANIDNSQSANERENSHMFVDISKPTPSYEPATNLPQRGLALQDIPDVSQRPRVNKNSHKQQTKHSSNPFVSPVNDPNRIWLDDGETPKSRKTQPNLARGTVQSSPINAHDKNDHIVQSSRNNTHPVHPDLALALDYETRKTKATQDHRKNLRRGEVAETARQQVEGAGQRTIDSLFAQYSTRPTPNSPHKNRQAKAVAALRPKSVTGTDDFAERKKLRLKMLPLESVKNEYWVSDLVLPFLTSIDAIKSQLQNAVTWDEFISRGEISNEIEGVEAKVLVLWETQFRKLLVRQYRKGDADGEDSACIAEGDVPFEFHGGFS